MISRIQALQDKYPPQFWLLFWGLLISTIGSSMIWPFLMIYASERTGLPMTSIASLMTLYAGMGFVSGFTAGPIADRLGRKWLMAFSLMLNALGYVFLSQANTLTTFAALMAVNGFAAPLYRVGADAMMADLIPPEERIQAYATLRLSNNLGVALGPTIGGFIAVVSYNGAFYAAAAGMGIYCLLVVFLARETLPGRTSGSPAPAARMGGYGRALKDTEFISFIAIFTFTQISAAILWVLLSVHVKKNYGIPENLYGFLPATNALMVVFLQLAVTGLTHRKRPFLMMALGACFYAVGVGSVALGRGFWGFWGSMVIMTVGELILTPTATTLVANLAPVDMRGRYMSLYGLTWGLSVGFGPLVGGLLNDHIGPAAIWVGGGLVGLASAAGFLVLLRLFPQRRSLPVGEPNPAA